MRFFFGFVLARPYKNLAVLLAPSPPRLRTKPPSGREVDFAKQKTEGGAAITRMFSFFRLAALALPRAAVRRRSLREYRGHALKVDSTVFALASHPNPL